MYVRICNINNQVYANTCKPLYYIYIYTYSYLTTSDKVLYR